MRRREVIAGLGAAVAWPRAVRAQQPAMPVIGYVSGSVADADASRVAAFLQGLKETGFVESRNVVVEYRWAEGHYEWLPAFAAEFTRRPVALIMAASLPAALAAKAATSAIPVVFVSGADPVKFGVVTSLGQPGGNLTGITQYYGALGAKRLEVLRGLVPAASKVAVMSNPKNPNADDHLRDIEAAGGTIGLRIEVLRASSEEEIDAAAAIVAASGIGALLIADDPFFNTRRDELVRLAARHKVPTIYYAREFAEAGGLIAYGSSTMDNYRQAGVYAGRILKGDKPADLPVLQPTKFELVINLDTAKALGLTIPPTLLARADEVIE
jgi:putative ABC transport system substrate-binding protein